MTARPAAGTGVLYHRDSEGRADCAPAQYVAWAAARAADLGVAFAGTPDQMAAMVRRRASADHPLYLDYGVSGNQLSRPGLDALTRAAAADRSISHVFVPRRDRLARPGHPLDGVQLELQLRQAGLTLVFLNRVADALPRGKRQDIADLTVGVLDYHYSGQFRTELAEKLLYAQVRLAKAGFSIGGVPPYGFERWLVREADRHPVRRLEPREHTKMAGHHACWLPTDDAKVAVLRRIVAELEAGVRAARVARGLTADGVPVPDPRRNATGVWHPTTVRNLARHPLLRAVVESGKRSEGDQLRFTPDGPQEMTDADYRADGRPKRRDNPPAARIAVPAAFDPVVDPARHAALVAELDDRGSHLRGCRGRGGPPPTRWAGGCGTWGAGGRCTGWPAGRRTGTRAG